MLGFSEVVAENGVVVEGVRLGTFVDKGVLDALVDVVLVEASFLHS